MFAGAPDIGERARKQVENEEGWILGVTGSGPVRVERHASFAETRTDEGAQAVRSHRAGSGRTTRPGYENRNGQIVVRNTGLPGTDHGQYIYVLRCARCGHEYGANGSGIFERRCPACQGREPGLPF